MLKVMQEVSTVSEGSQILVNQGAAEAVSTCLPSHAIMMQWSLSFNDALPLMCVCR